MKNNIPLKFSLFLFVMFIPLSLIAQNNRIFKYSINFFCGSPQSDILVPGFYLTAINVHNPTDDSCNFKKKFVLALPNQRPGKMTDFYEGTLGPHRAMEIDCPEIRKKLGVGENFLKGFVLIISNVRLNITAIYSAAGAQKQIETLHVEQILPISSSDESGKPCNCEKITEQGQQCLLRISKNSEIFGSRKYIKKYECGVKYRTEATFTLSSNQKCDETIKLIPDQCSIKTTGYEIIKSDLSGIFTGTFSLIDPNNKELASGDIYIISKVGTHRHPLPMKPKCERCDPPGHSEGFLCGKLYFGEQTFYLYCQVALVEWYPNLVASSSIATFEGILAK